jgi:hypothetical protein
MVSDDAWLHACRREAVLMSALLRSVFPEVLHLAEASVMPGVRTPRRHSEEPRNHLNPKQHLVLTPGSPR